VLKSRLPSRAHVTLRLPLVDVVLRCQMKALSTYPSLASCLLVVALLAACAGGEPGLPGTSGTLAGLVRCTYAYRQSNEQAGLQLEERVLRVAADQKASETLGRLTFSVEFRTSEQESDTISLSAADGSTSVLSILYQLPSGLPQNQFSGGHGFTGLLYFKHPIAGGDYQAFCESVR
jgi:hypothetical protein